MTGRYVEDYTVGEVIVAPAVEFTEDFIIDFAKVYDPQAIHIDKDYAVNEGSFGGLIASGFQTVAFSFKLYLEFGHFQGTGLAGPGMDEIRWLKPVFPDDPLTSHVEVLEARPSKSKPDRGLLRLGFTVKNGAGETVLTYSSMTMLKRRG